MPGDLNGKTKRKLHPAQSPARYVRRTQCALKKPSAVAITFLLTAAARAAHPAAVGTHWFQWLAEPAAGRNDSENYSIGFVDVTNQPYPELVAAAKLTANRLLEIHSG